MKLVVLAAGRPKDKNIALLAKAYIERIIPKGVAGIDFADAARDGNIEKEGASILKKLRERDTVILLDEHGKMHDSPMFADFISSSLAATDGRLVLVVGGAFGFSDDIRRRANDIISLSRMTMPHELCLLFLSEQLYRAFSIIAGTEYHHI